MKILHVITGLSTGGAEKALFNLLCGGLADKYENHVISLMDEGTIGPFLSGCGVSVHKLGMTRSIPSITSLYNFRKIVKGIQPDIIQGWMYHGNLASLFAKNIVGKKTILNWSIRQSLYDIRKEKILTHQVIRINRALSSKIDTIVYNSKTSMQQHEEYGFSGNNDLVIANGFDVSKYLLPNLDRRMVRKMFEIPSDALVIGHVARFHTMKDHDLFLKACQILEKRYPEIHFLLCGKGVTFRNEAFSNGISIDNRKRYHLLGERSDIPEIMAIMDIFCQSSWSEAFPNVLGEAMASGVPCVATNVGDSKDIIGDTGNIVEPRSINEMVIGLVKLIEMSEPKRKELGEKARVRIKTKYSIQFIIDKYISLYESQIQKKLCNI